MPSSFTYRGAACERPACALESLIRVSQVIGCSLLSTSLLGLVEQRGNLVVVLVVFILRCLCKKAPKIRVSVACWKPQALAARTHLLGGSTDQLATAKAKKKHYVKMSRSLRSGHR
jgi:hypothetical protein